MTMYLYTLPCLSNSGCTFPPSHPAAYSCLHDGTEASSNETDVMMFLKSPHNFQKVINSIMKEEFQICFQKQHNHWSQCQLFKWAMAVWCKVLLLKQSFTYKCFHNYPPPPNPQPEGNPCCGVNHYKCGSKHDDSLWCSYYCVRFLARWNTCYCAFIRTEGSPNRFYIISGEYMLYGSVWYIQCKVLILRFCILLGELYQGYQKNCISQQLF
jgi:hypothetical protein